MPIKIPEDQMADFHIVKGEWSLEAPTNTIYLKEADNTLATRVRMAALQAIYLAILGRKRSKRIGDNDVFDSEQTLPTRLLLVNTRISALYSSLQG